MNARFSAWHARACGLLLRYWARNMTVVHDQGGTWPGFGYTPGEQAALRAIARRVASFEFGVWMTLVVVFVMSFITASTLLGAWLSGALSAAPAPHAASDSVFYVSFGVELVVSLAVGFPAAMLLAGLITGRLFAVAETDLPDEAVRSHYVHKLGFQFTRIAFLGAAVIVALCLWLPERVWLLTRWVMPVLGPALSLVTVLFYAHRPRDPAQGVAADGRDSSSRST